MSDVHALSHCQLIFTEKITISTPDTKMRIFFNLIFLHFIFKFFHQEAGTCKMSWIQVPGFLTSLISLPVS